MGFEPGTFRLLLQHLNPLGHSPLSTPHSPQTLEIYCFLVRNTSFISIQPDTKRKWWRYVRFSDNGQRVSTPSKFLLAIKFSNLQQNLLLNHFKSRYPESESNTSMAEKTDKGSLEESELNLNYFPLSTFCFMYF